jgi:hypothetical protein
MQEVIWLYLGARKDAFGPGQDNTARGTDPLTDAMAAGEIFEAGGFLPVDVRQDKTAEATAVSLAYLSPAGHGAHSDLCRSARQGAAGGYHRQQRTS